MKKLIARVFVLGLTVSLALAGCGGGGISSPTASGAATTTSGTVAKVTAAGVTVQEIDFATADATVTTNGDQSSVADLKPGMKVTVSGSVDGHTGKAFHIEHEGELEGNVTAVSSVAVSFIVMGQTVLVSTDTVFDGITGFAALRAGDEVEVDGDLAATGEIVATRVEVKQAQEVTRKFISGLVTNLNSAAKTLVIRNVVVSYAGATLPSPALADGQAVLVRGALQDGIFVATKISLSGTAPSPAPAPTPAPAPAPSPAPAPAPAPVQPVLSTLTPNCASACHGLPPTSVTGMGWSLATGMKHTTSTKCGTCHVIGGWVTGTTTFNMAGVATHANGTLDIQAGLPTPSCTLACHGLPPNKSPHPVLTAKSYGVNCGVCHVVGTGNPFSMNIPTHQNGTATCNP